MNKLTTCLCAAALALSFAGLGCRSDPPSPEFYRLTTTPSGAMLTIPELGLRMMTPCDLPHDLSPNDQINVTKPGYLPFSGALNDLMQDARKTYHVELHRTDGVSSR